MSMKDFQNGFAFGFTSGRSITPIVLSDIAYTDVICNDDNTITLIDKNGIERTMECEYVDGELTSVKYGGKAVKLTYDGDALVKVGKTTVDFENVLTEIDALENLIDESGVLEDTEGSVTEKVEELIDNTLAILQASTINFGGKEITEVTMNCKGMNSLQNSFANCRYLKTVKLSNTQNVNAWGYAFSQTQRLETLGDLDFSSMTSVQPMFYGSGGLVLKNLTIIPETIKVSVAIPSYSLTEESIQSIIDGLVTLKEGATAQTLTLNKALETTIDEETGKPILSDERKAQIQAKRWTLSLS